MCPGIQPPSFFFSLLCEPYMTCSLQKDTVVQQKPTVASARRPSFWKRKCKCMPKPSVPFWHNAVNQHFGFLKGWLLKAFYLRGRRCRELLRKMVISVDMQRKGAAHSFIAPEPIFTQKQGGQQAVLSLFVKKKKTFVFWPFKKEVLTGFKAGR